MTTFICLHPHHAFTFLVASSDFDVTAEFLVDSFVILYSEYGSNNHTIEESIILNWSNYLANCKGNSVSIKDIVHFISGSSKLPAAGFEENPIIRFTDNLCLPISSTCDVSITFPRSFGHLPYEEFKQKMDLSITNSFGFGLP